MDQAVTEALRILEAERDALQMRYGKLSSAAEAARIACVPVQQRLSKIEDAISTLETALKWEYEEVPL